MARGPWPAIAVSQVPPWASESASKPDSPGHSGVLVQTFRIGWGKGDVPGTVRGLEGTAANVTDKSSLHGAYIVIGEAGKTGKQAGVSAGDESKGGMGRGSAYLWTHILRKMHILRHKGNKRFSHSSVGKESTCNAEDPGSIPGLGRPPGEGKGYPLQYSGLENPMDRGLQELDATEQLSLSFKGSKEGHRQMSGQEARTPAQGLLLFARATFWRCLDFLVLILLICQLGVKILILRNLGVTSRIRSNEHRLECQDWGSLIPCC